MEQRCPTDSCLCSAQVIREDPLCIGGQTMYHERQKLMYCAMHALNNLFQEHWADRELMERLALELFNREAALREESGMGKMWTNPFKSMIPKLGDYDVSVLIEALKIRHCHVSLHAVYNLKDPDRFVSSIVKALDVNTVRGIVVNFVSRTLMWGAWVNHHFYSIIKVEDEQQLAPASVMGPEHTATSSPAETSPRCRPARAGREINEKVKQALSAHGEAESLTEKSKTRSPRRRGRRDQTHKNKTITRSTRCQESSNAVSSNSRDRRSNHRCPLVQHYPNYESDSSPLTSPIEKQNFAGGDTSKTTRGSEVRGGANKEVWYSLDSRLSAPKRLGGTEELLQHLLFEARDHRGHVFVVSEGCETEESDGNAI